ncbi:MAG TPA: protein kinase, partial [Terriglobia bacterium]|nr:protein kinase [Terriglobia bacterium]
LGTAAYMSPEQAKGQRVDRRADIWAFGCVLYEMLSGRKPFEGETISDVLAAVIMKDPDWAAKPEATPQAIKKLIYRCLQKDRRQRLQAIGEARITIEETISGVGEGSALPGVSPEQREPKGLPYRILPWALAAVGFLLAAVLVVAYLFKSPAAPVQSIQSLITAPEKVSFVSYGQPVLSPDGKRMVLRVVDAAGSVSLWVRPLDSLTAERLQGTGRGGFPFWAPDSRQLGFFQDGKLKKIDVTGGPPVLICDAPAGLGGAWSKSGVIIFAPQLGAAGLSSVPAAGGTASAIVGPKGPSSNRWPVFLPDGRHFLYSSGGLGAAGTSKLGIYVGELGSNEQKFLLQSDSQALYSPPGYLLFLRGDTLMAQRFDAGSLKLEGGAFPVAEHIPSTGLRLGLFSVSQTGLLVYATGGGESSGQLVWMDASGKEIAKVGPPEVSVPALSPDGKRLAYMAVNSGGNGTDIWLMDLARGVQTRFTFGPRYNAFPVWSPDGTRIAYSSYGANGVNILVKAASGAGNAETLFKADANAVPNDWSRDARYILFFMQNDRGDGDIWALPLFGERKPFPYLQTQFNEGDSFFSPDGHWVAYVSDESGSYEVYLSPFPPGGGKWQVSQGGGVQPQWRHDGSALYYLAPGGKLMEASVKEKGSVVEIGAPHELFQKPFSRLGLVRPSYVVTPEGKRFLVNVASEAASAPLTLVTNWPALLKKQ